MAGKNSALDGLRGVAALGVLLSHLLFSLFPYLANNMVPNSAIPLAHGWEPIAMLPPFMMFFNGSFAVSIFFVLSGYVLTKKFFETGDTRGLVSGAIKRYPRLVIPAAVSVLFAWVLLSLGAMNNDLIPILGSAGWPYGQYEQSVTFTEALRAAFIGAPIFSDTALNSPLWTIRIELLGSLFLFAAYFIGGTKRFAVTFICFLAMAYAANWGNIIIVHFVAIFAGSLLNRAPNLSRISWYLIGLGLVGGAFDYSVFYAWVPTMGGHEKLLMNSVGALLLVAGILNNTTVSRILTTRIPRFLGHVSFPMYLLHWPIICSFSFGMIYVLKLQLGFNHEPSAFIVLALTVPIVLALSYYFEKWVDAPAMSFSSNLAKRLMRSPPIAASA